jgi:succinate-acetate transporter protein
MTTVDATAGESRRPAVAEEAPAAVIGPLAGDPSIFGLGSFIAGSVALGLGLVGVVPTGVLGAPLAIILSATALGLLVSAVWCAALGQSAVAAVFGIFGTFWLSYGVLVLGLDHGWFAITTAPPAGASASVTAAVAAANLTATLNTVELFLITWLVVIVMLTLSTLRLPSAFTAVFALVDLALLLLLLAFEESSAAGVPSSGLLKTGGVVVLIFAAVGVYLFFSASAAGTGGKPLPLGPPLMK